MTKTVEIDEKTAIPVDAKTVRVVTGALVTAAGQIVKDAAAKKAARKLAKDQVREAQKAKKQNAAKAEIVEACQETKLVLPEGIDLHEGGTLDNCYRLLEAQPWGFAYDELAQEHVFRGDVIWPSHYGRVLNDALVLAIQFSIIGVFGVEFSKQQVESTLLQLCRANPFNPVTEYLTSVRKKYDGKKRVAKWPSTYLGAPDDDYTGAAGAVLLVGAVARAFDPGSKFDTMPIFEGDQGSGKSTALSILGGEWYSDAELGNLKDKDAPMVLRSVWIHEMPELSSMSRSERNTMKAFVSRAADRYRPTRANLPINQPRRCIHVGTYNPEGVGYLTDTSGNRRYLPIETGKIELEALRLDRDMLWAEAVKMYEEDFSTVMPKKLWKKAAEVAAERVSEEPWLGLVADWLKQEHGKTKPRDRVQTHEVLAEACSVSADRMTRQDGNRLGPIMRALGFSKDKFAVAGGKPLNGWKLPSKP